MPSSSTDAADALALALEREEILLRIYIALADRSAFPGICGVIAEHLGLEGTAEAVSVLESLRNPYGDCDDEVPF